MNRRVLGMVFVLCCTGCDGTETDNPVALAPNGVNLARSSKAYLSTVNVSAADARALEEGNVAFSLDLYRQIASSASADQNLFLAPYSVSTAMAMLYAGAQGATATEIASTLHFTLEPSALHPAFNQLRQGLKISLPTLVDVDGIWLERGCNLNPPYLDVLSEQYDTGVYQVDFSGRAEDSRVAINDWVAAKTDQKIVDLFPSGSVNNLTVLVATNAVTFSAPWEYPFDPRSTTQDPFTLTNGEQITVPMMHGRAVLPHATGSTWEAAALPYVDQPVSMVFVLPLDGQLAQFEATLDLATLRDITGGLLTSRQDTVVLVPKFTFSDRADIRGALASLGMNTAIQGPADFSGISDCGIPPISYAANSTYVAVDEVGTVASAATGIVDSSMDTADSSFVLNRPFLFFLWHSATNTMLFLGRVAGPTM